MSADNRQGNRHEIKNNLSSKNPAFVDAVTQKNVELTISDIRKKSAVLAELESKGAIKIAGSMYNWKQR